MDVWNGLRLLNTGRGNNSALQTLNRADAAMAPAYWDVLPAFIETPELRIVELADGTFGLRWRVTGQPMTSAPDRWFLLSTHILTLVPGHNPAETTGFQLMGFGGLVTFAPINGQVSANLGSVILEGTFLEYRIRAIPSRETNANFDIWIRYALDVSNENI